MFINAIDIPNPVLFTGSEAYVAHTNAVIGGIHMTKILRQPTEGGTPYAQKRSLLRFQFEDLTISDMYLMETAWFALTMDYCIVKMPGLGMNLWTYPGGGDLLYDAAWMTVAPNAVLTYELYQGTALGKNGLWEGPYLGKATFSLLTGDMRYSTIP